MSAEPLRIPPDDAHNRQLVANVHPPDWVNPTPDGRYNLVVIGAGTGGLVTALVAASLGGKVALVERHLMGGDCLNVGCVPSKAAIRAAHLVHEARTARALGLLPGAPEAVPDFAAAWERMRRVRSEISEEDSARRYTDEFGVEVFLGEARFAGDGVVRLGDGTRLEYAKAVIATGARAAAPPVPGLQEAGYLDNETVFQLTARPPRLAVIGAGPIGCELAQTFRRLGSEVTILERADQILVREDPDAAGVLQQAMARDGVEMVFGCEIARVERDGDAKVLHVTDRDGSPRRLVVDEVLVGAGRAPNVEDLGLETVGVEHDTRNGVTVDDFLRTSNRRIYAVGDVCMAWKFTHAADAAAKIVVQNALFFGRKRLSRLVMPWCTYTDPEIAHVGLHARDADEGGVAIDTFQVPLTAANRAVTDGRTEGFVKVHVRRGGDRVVGATIVAHHAGDLIPLLTLAIQRKVGLGAFTDLIFPYPTQAEAIKRAAGEYTRGRLTPGVKRWFERFLRWRR